MAGRRHSAVDHVMLTKGRRPICIADYAHDNNNKAIVDCRLRLCHGANSQGVLPVFIVEQNLVGISAAMLVVFYRRLRRL